MPGILDAVGGLFGGKKKQQQGRSRQPSRAVGITQRVQTGPPTQMLQPAARQWQAPLEAGVDSGAAMQGAAYNTGGWPNARLQGMYGRAVQPVYGSEDEPASMYLEEPYY